MLFSFRWQRHPNSTLRHPDIRIEMQILTNVRWFGAHAPAEWSGTRIWMVRYGMVWYGMVWYGVSGRTTDWLTNDSRQPAATVGGKWASYPCVLHSGIRNTTLVYTPCINVLRAHMCRTHPHRYGLGFGFGGGCGMAHGYTFACAYHFTCIPRHLNW